MIRGVAALALLAWPVGATAQSGPRQTVPVIDTEDATLGETEVPAGRLRAILTFDIRNGDYARGAYDDDNADLSRVPVHAAIAVAAVLVRGDDGAGRLFLTGQNSNGFHAPAPDEQAAPRIWYESNSIVALAWRPGGGVTAAAAYAVKTSPNGVSGTTHEASLSGRLAGERGLAWLRPQAVATVRTKGDTGLFTLAGIGPQIALGDAEDAPRLALPALVGIGWGGFYGPGSGTLAYASIGASVEQGIGPHATLRGELLALIRDDGLRVLDAPRGTTATVVPVGTIALTIHW